MSQLNTLESKPRTELVLSLVPAAFTCMNAYLLEPFFAQILGLLFGIDKFPGTITILGVIAVAFGTVIAHKGSQAMLQSGKRTIPKVEGDYTGAQGNRAGAAEKGSKGALSGGLGSADEEELS